MLPANFQRLDAGWGVRLYRKEPLTEPAWHALEGSEVVVEKHSGERLLVRLGAIERFDRHDAAGLGPQVAIFRPV